ncbi:hypothetical protein QBC42DRAFT_339064 [Cladorrhinum samala]|uniref:Exosome complex protein n=1 Tax=Cladorrhinum samala TaxID=585594 RepID=A0AAV9HMZ4_9PEZI|nr:hypothetical protein QBC42DRAFT_339064 [Cladorrhinum samala]
MDVSDVTPQLEQLDVDLNKLEEVLKPLLGDFGDLSSKLPLLDKSKLYVLMAYSIESLLFSSLRLNGVDTKNHAIYTELTRVKQYFEKIQKLETPPAERETKVNTEAVARFVKNDLAGSNKDIQNKLTELIAREKAKATAAATSSSDKKRSADEAASEGRSIEPQDQKSSARPAPSRPTVPARGAPAPTHQQQTRPATTYAPSAARPSQAPNAGGAAPTASQGPGLLGQMASTAAGVAIGSSIGHMVGNGISSMFGGSSEAGAPEASTQAQAAPQNGSAWGNNCAGATTNFTKCMDENGGNMQICGWYLEQLKACQAAASQY